MGLNLLGQQVTLGDLQLFLLRIGGHLDDLHTVQQRAGDGVHRVGRGDEHHPAQVEGQLHVVVAEGAVLFRVQHLQQGAGGVAAEVAAHLVNFVKEEHRVHGARLLDARDNPAGNRADVGAPVAADFRFIPHAAQGHLHKLAPHRLGDSPDDGGFAHAGRAHKAKDWALHVLLHAQNGQVFDNALLDLFQPVVILGQHPPGPLEVKVVGSGFSPGQVKNPFNIGAADVHLRGAGSHAGQALQLLLALLPGLFVEGRFFHAIPQIVGFHGFAVAQLSLDSLHLLPQIIILLILLNLLLDTGLHLFFHPGQLGFPGQDAAQGFQTALDVQFLQNALAILHTGEDVGRNNIGNLIRRVHIPHGVHRFLADPLARLGIGLKKVLRRANKCLQLRVVFRHGRVGELHVALQVGFLLGDRLQYAPAFTLHEHAQVVPGQVHHLFDGGDGAHPAQFLHARVFHLRILLGDQENLLVFQHGLFQCGH